jgi:hypothetical protein
MRVYFTVDTETSMGGAWSNPDFIPLPLDLTVFGKRGAQFYGIPLIMDILEEHGFRASFFIEVFCAYILGREEVAKVFAAIRGRGHDCQLHIHPTYRFYRDYHECGLRRETDLMFELPAKMQRNLIAEGVRLFTELGGLPPRAYRAGCYGASETTLVAVRENGLEIDTSYNLAYLGETCGFQVRPLNAPAVIEGVHEFPITVFRVSGLAGVKPLEISAVSVSEILAAIDQLREVGCRDVVLVLHSFSLLKNLGVRYEKCSPNHIVIRRLRKLCAVLADRKSEIEVCVFQEARIESISVPQPQVVPTMGWLQPAVRKFVQGVNRLPWI